MKKDIILTLRKLYRERYSRAKEKYASNLSNDEKEYIHQLKTEGIVIIKNYFTKEFCNEVISLIDSYIIDHSMNINDVKSKLKSNKSSYKFGVPQEDGTSFWIDEKESDYRIINAQNISNKLNSLFSLNDFFMKIGSSMLESHLNFNFTMINKTTFVSENLGSGGGWHRDNNYQFGFKALVYLSDVTEGNGQFEYLKKSYSLKNHLIDFPYPDKYQFSDEEIQNYLINHKDVLIKVIGEAGTLVLFNTNGIHRGSPVLQGQRYAMTNYYKDSN